MWRICLFQILTTLVPTSNNIPDLRTNAFEPADAEAEVFYNEDTLDSIWWHKVEPLSGKFRKACTECYMPSDSVSINESIIYCFGHSTHTYTMQNKPISQGYRLYAPADHGYVWYWIWASRAKSMAEIVEGLTKTGSMVYQLLQKLPREPGCYTVYLDNYFISINLLK